MVTHKETAQAVYADGSLRKGVTQRRRYETDRKADKMR